MKKLITVTALLLVFCTALLSCNGTSNEEIITDVDSEKVLSELTAEGRGDSDYVLNVGESKTIAIRLLDSEKDKTVSVTSSNPFAVFAENLLTIPECAFVVFSARGVGGSTVTVDITNEDGSVIRSESILVTVPMQEIFAADFGVSDGETTLELGESLVDKLTVYSLGCLFEEDVDFTSSDESVLELEGYELFHDEISTHLSFSAVTKSVGTATLCAKLPDGRSASITVNVIEGEKPSTIAPSANPAPDSEVTPSVTPSDDVAENTESTELTYILNIKSKRFHHPECRGVRDMKDENKSSFYGSRDDAISQGYKPCGTCKP